MPIRDVESFFPQSPKRIRFLANRQTREQVVDPRLRDDLERARIETAALRERLRSPRHRVADAAANLLHKIPIVWPLVAKITDAILRREQTKK